jgi:hypothetical protein
MITKREYDELYRLIEAYSDAWEAYVRAVHIISSERYSMGVLVTDAKENLLKYLKEQA